MKVILNQDVKALGKKGAVVEVSDGYARNFLFVKKLAVEANSGNLNVLNNKKESEKHKKDLEKEQAQELAKKISVIELKFKIKAGENGKVFGSITSKDISEKLEKEYKVVVDKKKILLSDAIKLIGISTVEIKLYENIHAKVKVIIEQEV